MRRRELEVRTGDGRRLIAREAGPADGALLLFHTGTPGSRLLFDRHLREGAERGLRHVTYSRPGYHGSDRLPGRSIADCAADCAAIADALGDDSFYVAGGSGGGGHAIACAALLPERVIAAASIATLGPRQGEGLDWLDGTGQSNVEEFAALEAGEDELARFLERAYREMGSIDSASQLREGFGDLLCEPDRECLTGAFLEFQVIACREAARDGIWGWLDDDLAMWKEWGFDLDRVDVPLAIWQGAEDAIVPAQNGQWLADRIPGAKLRLLPGEGHLSLLTRYYGAILDELIATPD